MRGEPLKAANATRIAFGNTKGIPNITKLGQLMKIKVAMK